ncbi:MAG: adenylate/guanylate cyclase domain-containing protein [Pseudomonadota bacterium]
MTHGRLLNSPAELTDGLCPRLVEAGAPLWRLRFAPRLANPLLRAWGIVWRRDDGAAQEYAVEHGVNLTSVYIGSPFEYVIEKRQRFRRRLTDLDPETDHTALHDVAEAGGTDFLALPMLFHDGSAQGVSLATDRPTGFTDGDIASFERIIGYLTPVIEVMAGARSTGSLLKTYLGTDPAAAVLGGAVRRGDVRTMEAVVLMADLRGFTAKSLAWQADDLLHALSTYFEVICEAVAGADGDVLKFIGDGVLAIFPVDGRNGSNAASRAGLAACADAHRRMLDANAQRRQAGRDPLDFVVSLHRGPVTYGNIGGADRLDFTVIGPAVNVASRLQGLCKALGVFGLTTESVAQHAPSDLPSCGRHDLPGIPDPVPIFEIPSGA